MKTRLTKTGLCIGVVVLICGAPIHAQPTAPTTLGDVLREARSAGILKRTVGISYFRGERFLIRIRCTADQSGLTVRVERFHRDVHRRPLHSVLVCAFGFDGGRRSLVYKVSVGWQAGLVLSSSYDRLLDSGPSGMPVDVVGSLVAPFCELLQDRSVVIVASRANKTPTTVRVKRHMPPIKLPPWVKARRTTALSLRLGGRWYVWLIGTKSDRGRVLGVWRRNHWWRGLVTSEGEELLKARIMDKRWRVIRDLSSIYNAQVTYRMKDLDGNGVQDFAVNLRELARAGLIDKELGDGKVWDYCLRLCRSEEYPEYMWMVVASPSSGSGESFVTNHEGVTYSSAQPLQLDRGRCAIKGGTPVGR